MSAIIRKMKLNSFYFSIFSFTLIVSNFLNVGEDSRFVTVRSIALTSGLTLQALLSKVDAKSPWLLSTLLSRSLRCNVVSRFLFLR